jgi:hypothetical protein
VSGEAIVLFERRETGEQDAAGFAFVACQGESALQDVPGGQHAQFVAQLAGAAAAVEHGDDGVELQPGVGLQAAEQARQAGSASHAADLQLV